MKVFFKPYKSAIAIIAFIFCSATITAQTWSGNCITWGGNPCNMTASPATGTTSELNFAPYFQWSTFEYTLSTPINITSNSTVTFGVNTAIGSSVAGKSLVVVLVDATNQSSQLNSNVVVGIPSNGQEQNYSIDFKLATPSNFDFTQVSKLKFWIATTSAATSSPSGISGSFTISNVQFGNGVQGVTSLTNPSTGQLWNLTSRNALINSNTGNIQIGNFSNVAPSLVSDPYYKFIVNGRSNFIGNDNVMGLWSAATTANGRHYLGISNTTFSSGIEYSSITSSVWTGSAGIPKPLTFQNFEDPQGNGNVGIGYHTSAPVSKLSVNGNVQVGGIAVSPYGTEGSRLYFGGLEENSDRLYFSRFNISDNSTALRLHIGDDDTKDDVFEIGSVFHANGQWRPGVRISSSGTIAAKEVCVNATLAWCDYVFDKDYKLMSIQKLKEFINEHKHLPEIPSAEEIEKSGLNVNLLLTMHMKKIEELTLYTISQDEKLAEMEERLKALESLILNNK